MKRTLSILSLTMLAAFVVSSCETNEDYILENDFIESLDTFVAETESYGDLTKTSLSPTNSVVWSSGDRLSIFQGATIADIYEIKSESAGKTEGVFSYVEQSISGENSDFSSGTEINANIALYPYEDNLTCSGISVPDEESDKVSYLISNVTISEIQDYAENSFSSGAFAMVAVTNSLSDHNLRFRNVLGALELRLCGNCVVKSITVQGNNNELLAGSSSIVATPGDVPKISIYEEGAKSVMLDCGEGVMLDPTNPTRFIFALPPVSFTKGFTVTVVDSQDNEMVINNKASNRVLRSTILKMPKLTIPLQGDADNILFEDPIIENLCVDAFDTNSDGALSYEEAAAVTDLSTLDCAGADFESFVELQYFTSVDQIPADMFLGCNKMRSIVLPEGLLSIGDRAFLGCADMTSLTIPDGVTSIGEYAFRACNSLTDITIPGSVESLKKGLFYEAKSLITVRVDDGVKSIEEKAFYDCMSLKSVDIGEGVTVIGNRAFYECAALTDLLLPTSLRSIGDEAFKYCFSLKSLILPNELESIGYDAFGNCESLTHVTLPSSITTIGNKAFSVCKSLTKITIPSSITSMGGSVFSGCSSLAVVILESGITNVWSGVFEYCGSLVKVVLPESVTSIGSNAFSGCRSLTSVTIPSGVTTIGSGAFSDCRSLTSITIPSGVTKIEESTFSGCSSLTSVTIPSGVTEIGHYAFSGCSSLPSITIPSGVTMIGSYLFSGCSSLTSVTIPSDVTAIGNDAFSGCSSLTSVTIPSGVTEIIERTFSDCGSLTSVTIPSGVTTIGSGAFSGCSSLTSVTIPSGVTVICPSAFQCCSKLSSITIPSGVIRVGGGAFAECSSLESVTLIGGEDFYFDYDAFSGCTNVTTLYIKSKNRYNNSNIFEQLEDFTALAAIYVPADEVETYKIYSLWDKYNTIIQGWDDTL